MKITGIRPEIQKVIDSLRRDNFYDTDGEYDEDGRPTDRSVRGFWFLDYNEDGCLDHYILKNRHEEGIEINVWPESLQLYYTKRSTLQIDLSKDEEKQIHAACRGLIDYLNKVYIVKQIEAIEDIGKMELDWVDEDIKNAI
jgi:hypothetical protein